MKTIIIDVLPDGSVNIDAVGFKGQACKKATEAIEKALGGKVTTKNKPEFYQTEKIGQRIGG